MRRASVLLALALPALLILAGCVGGLTTVYGSGNVKTEPRAVSGFTAVALSGIGHLTIQQTGAESLSIEAEDNILPLLTSDVSGGRLTLGVKPFTSISPTKPINYTLTVKVLSEVEVSGAGDVVASGLTASNMRLTISGSGSTTLTNLSTSSTTVSVSGSGVVTLSGQTQSQDVTISGTGSYRTGDFASKTAKVEVSGEGDVLVRVSDTLNAHVSGSGTVEYIGNPTVTKSISGTGAVRQR